MESIMKVYELVERECKKETNYFGYGIWSHHILSVVKYSKLLANKLKVNIEVVELAALLHDYSSIKNKDFYEDHHIHSTKFAEEILIELGYSSDIIEKVNQCILNHRGSKINEKISVEEKIVADANALAHFDNISSLFYLAFFSHKKNIDEAENWLKGKLKRSWNKLSLQESKNLVKLKYEAAMLLLS